MPSQKEGIDPNRIIPQSMLTSIALARFQAEIAPRTMPMMADISREEAVMSRVHGSRSASISTMGSFWRYE